ncbi:MAG TPA: hypothetical protein VLB74_11870 [Flavobacterium sp.]|uniref:hypothetical protein n=1 Tax=Flavobacterium sp. TaxID=239 RepID=UPI002C341386|nr:hypothetical protein [Flavobacterium sp.]HSD15337.1 hypothetical protein [Flavobacterium sp.]
MKTYSLVLKFDRFDLLKSDKQTIINLIEKKPFIIDYFGDQLDSIADYFGDEMQTEFDKSTYINLSLHPIYEHLDLYCPDIKNTIDVVTAFVDNSESLEVSKDGKDIVVYCG